MTQTIRYYKEETRCNHCGRHIKNVVEVDGVQYGIVCCDSFIESKATVRKINRTDFAQLVIEQERANKQAEKMELLQYAIDTLPVLFGATRSHFLNKPNAYLEQFLSDKPDSPLTLGIIALLESRKITY